MTKTAYGKAIVSAQIPFEARDELVHLAQSDDRTLSAEIRRALVGYLERERQAEAQEGKEKVPR